MPEPKLTIYNFLSEKLGFVEFVFFPVNISFALSQIPLTPPVKLSIFRARIF